jgi:hypothetical protein
MPNSLARVRGRKSRFPGKSVQLSVLLPVATHVALQRLAAQLTEADQYPCSLADAIAHAIHKTTRTAMPAGTLHRPTQKEAKTA